MNWLKRNLFLVLGALAALVLLGLAGFYLYQQKQKETQVTAALEAQITEWKRLTNRKPSANEENIEAAKKAQAALAELLKTNREYFEPASTVTNMDSATFKNLLENTIFDLEQKASRHGVSLPRNYHFTTESLRKSVVFQEAELVPLAHQLAELKALCEVLFEARIHSLQRIRRVPVSKQDTGSTEYLTNAKMITNSVTGAVITPYEVTFNAFSAELAAVLTGLQQSRHPFMVRMMDVEHAPDTGSMLETMPVPMSPGYTAPMPGQPPPSGADLMRQRYGQTRGGPGGGGMSRDMMERYGIRPGGARPGVPQSPGTVYAPAAPTRRGPETVLEEKQLKVTLTVEAVRLPPTAE
jgi:hypothetical protein